MTKWKKGVILALSALLLIGIGSVITYALTRPKAVLPRNISRQLEFSPFVVSSDSKVSTNKYQIIKIDKDTQALLYHFLISGTDVTVTQYVQPNQFVDIPNFKDQFLSKAFDQYANVQTANGVIYYGHSAKLENFQFGIMVEKGLVLYMNPAKELSEQQWRTIGNSLTIENTNT